MTIKRVESFPRLPSEILGRSRILLILSATSIITSCFDHFFQFKKAGWVPGSRLPLGNCGVATMTILFDDLLIGLEIFSGKELADTIASSLGLERLTGEFFEEVESRVWRYFANSVRPRPSINELVFSTTFLERAVV